MTAGSPPRVRGKLHLAAGHALETRITPARAGKTGQSRSKTMRSRDHPRACGENHRFSNTCPPCGGSPPRVRGKLYVGAGIVADAGITPARAGKTFPPFNICCPAADHPRACGENNPSQRKALYPCGSPPRVRGKRLGLLDDVVQLRITPARAGKTFAVAETPSAGKDHPRACGENTSAANLL